jgi:membrane protease YdiL (CAAX protease family)
VPVEALASALVNLVVLAGVPLALYASWHRLRHRRPLRESAGRAGLRVGDPRYLLPALAVAALSGVAIAVWPPSPALVRSGSAMRPFLGLGASAATLALALLYGVVKTGFSEELLFRGLIAGSLGRRLPLWAANLLQALVFLAPHLLILRVMPEMWPLLPIVFATSLVLGWLRIRSGSILGPWLIHAAANVTTALSVALRTGG